MERWDLNDLAVFSAIAQAGSITGAAKKMKLPKSNVSRRRARLEDRLGVQLAERNSRSSRLTSFGVCYADYCRLMVDEANAADAVFETSLGGTNRGTAHLGIGSGRTANHSTCDSDLWSTIPQSTGHHGANQRARQSN